MYYKCILWLLLSAQAGYFCLIHQPLQANFRVQFWEYLQDCEPDIAGDSAAELALLHAFGPTKNTQVPVLQNEMNEQKH